MSEEPAALSFDDAVEVLRPAFPNDALILVGGQALNYWVLRYRAIDPHMPKVVGVASSDVDFLGTGAEAKRFGRAVRGTWRLARFDDLGPNTAVVEVTMPTGESRVVDFIGAVHGIPNTKTVRETALDIEPLDGMETLAGSCCACFTPFCAS